MTTRENQNGKKKTARHTSKSCENSPKKPDTVKNDIDIPQTLESLKRAISTGFEKTFDYMGIQDRKTQETDHNRQHGDMIQEQEQRKSPARS